MDIEGSPKSFDLGKTLPNKYMKLMHFGFWLLSNTPICNSICDPTISTNNHIEDVLDKLCLYANVETQADFYEKFYASEKEIAKSMRKFIAEKMKDQRKVDITANEIVPKGRDQILRDAFIDNIIASFTKDRVNIITNI